MYTMIYKSRFIWLFKTLCKLILLNYIHLLLPTVQKFLRVKKEKVFPKELNHPSVPVEKITTQTKNGDHMAFKYVEFQFDKHFINDMKFFFFSFEIFFRSNFVRMKSSSLILLDRLHCTFIGLKNKKNSYIKPCVFASLLRSLELIF